MSTKIYNVFRIKTRNLTRLLSLLQTYRQANIKSARLQVVEYLNTRPEFNAPKAEGEYRSGRWDKYKQDVHMREKHSEFYDGCEDLDVGYYIMDDGYTYIKPAGKWTQIKKLTEEFEKHRYIKEYHYQNQCDKPDSISEEEWDLRELTWDNILEKGNGYSFKHFNWLTVIPDFVLIDDIPYCFQWGYTSDSKLDNELTQSQLRSVWL